MIFVLKTSPHLGLCFILWSRQSFIPTDEKLKKYSMTPTEVGGGYLKITVTL